VIAPKLTLPLRLTQIIHSDSTNIKARSGTSRSFAECLKALVHVPRQRAATMRGWVEATMNSNFALSHKPPIARIDQPLPA
jgi:hypothetical protein